MLSVRSGIVTYTSSGGTSVQWRILYESSSIIITGVVISDGHRRGAAARERGKNQIFESELGTYCCPFICFTFTVVLPYPGYVVPSGGIMEYVLIRDWWLMAEGLVWSVFWRFWFILFIIFFINPSLENLPKRLKIYQNNLHICTFLARHNRIQLCYTVRIAMVAVPEGCVRPRLSSPATFKQHSRRTEENE